MSFLLSTSWASNIPLQVVPRSIAWASQAPFLILSLQIICFSSSTSWASYTPRHLILKLHLINFLPSTSRSSRLKVINNSVCSLAAVFLQVIVNIHTRHVRALSVSVTAILVPSSAESVSVTAILVPSSADSRSEKPGLGQEWATTCRSTWAPEQ
jgi:hypothetical protein